MKKIFIIFSLLIVFVSFVYADRPSDKVKEFTLSNGIRFFVYERHHVPTFAGMIMVKVGSIDERKGERGLAHFFEHMAFKGTTLIGTNNYEKEKILLDEMDKIDREIANEYTNSKKGTIDQKKIELLKAKMADLQSEHKKYVVKEEFSKVYVENGGRYLNATTGYDTTQYFVMLPSNRLELWFLMESERFKHPVLREFHQERNVILEEKRGKENNPDSLLWYEFMSIAFIFNPYRNPVIGYTDDIERFNEPMAKNFFNTFYVPNNMVAAVVGDVDFNAVRKLAEKYFGDMPKSMEPPKQEFIEPEQKSEKRIVVRYDTEPQLIIGYHMPKYSERDNVILDLISNIIGAGNSSRLKRDIIVNKELAIDISCYTNAPGNRFNSLFVIEALPRYPHTTSEVENAIYEHLEKIKVEPITKDEIERAINQEEASLYQSSGYAENVFIARRLLWNILICNDVDNEFKRVEIMKTITQDEIMDVAKKYFKEPNRIVGVIKKNEK